MNSGGLTGNPADASVVNKRILKCLTYVQDQSDEVLVTVRGCDIDPMPEDAFNT